MEQFYKMRKEWSLKKIPLNDFITKPGSTLRKVKLGDFIHADGYICSEVNPNLKMFGNCLEDMLHKIKVISVR